MTRQSSNDRSYCGAQFLVAVRTRNANYIGGQQQKAAMSCAASGQLNHHISIGP
jgi:hypothetical protein